MIKYRAITYKGCCGQQEKVYQVPDTITPYDLTLLIPGLKLEEALKLLETRIVPSDDCIVYQSAIITRQVRKQCTSPAVGSLVTITIPAGMFSSTISQIDANNKAEAEFTRISQSTANSLGTCTYPPCVNCIDYRVTRNIACGEYRRPVQCINGNCVDTGQEYFVCTGQCNGESCLTPCTTCSNICPNGPCPVGYSCVNGVCKANCTNAVCSTNCPQGSCPICQTCVNGQCVPVQCPTGQTCVNGVCAPIVCNPTCTRRIVTNDPLSCKQTYFNQVCVNGVCQDSGTLQTEYINEGGSCGENKTCISGSCVSECRTLDMSCDQNNPCCPNLFCLADGIQFSRCTTTCPQGYILTGNFCNVDTRPNVLFSQTVTNFNVVVYKTNIDQYFTGGDYLFGVENSGWGVITTLGQSYSFLSLSVSIFNSTGFFAGFANYQGDPLQPGVLDAAFNWYIQNEIAPKIGSLFNISFVSQPTYQIILTQKRTNLVYLNTEPVNRVAVLNNVTETVVDVYMRMSLVNPYGIPTWVSIPSSFVPTFNNNWEPFTLNYNNGVYLLEGRLKNEGIEVRNSTNTPIFGTGSFPETRLVNARFTKGNIVIDTLI